MIQRARTSRAALFIVALGLLPVPASAATSAGAPDLTGLSGRELVGLMSADGTRLAAFRELSRRKGRKDLADLRRPELIPCPQGEGQPPLYVVLAEFLPLSTASGVWGSSDVEDLFPAESAAPEDPLALRDHLLIEVVSAEGEILDPFGGNNVLNGGVIRDLDGDGRVERLDHTPYGVEGVDTVDVLSLWPVAVRAEPRLRVLFNWGEDEWGYQLADRDGDGRVEIELGPRLATGLEPRVTFRWDPRSREFESDAGTQGEHFRVLSAGDPWPQFEKWKADGLRFRRDPQAVRAGRPVEPDPTRSSGALAPSSAPYVYRSLRDLDDDALLRYMGDGARPSPTWPGPARIPADLWATSPRLAATALLDENRTTEHRQAYRVAIDDRDVEPPAAGTIVFHGASAPCYEASDWVWFLSARPGDSYLAYGSSSRAGTVFFDFVRTQPVYDLRYASLADADARYLLQVVWWLSRVRTRQRPGDHEGGFMVSTGDGSGRLTLVAADGSVADASGALWAGGGSERWAGDYDGEVFLNFAAQVLTTALPERLGRDWAYPPRGCTGGYCRREGRASAPAAEVRRLVQDAEVVLDRFRPDGRGLPPALAALAVNALAEVQPAAHATRFEALRQVLPARDPHLPSPAALEAQLRALVAGEKEAATPEQTSASLARLTELSEELDGVREGRDEASGRELLREALLRASRQRGTGADLEAWAKSEEPGWRLALSALRERDPAAYVRTLEHWLERTRGESRRQVFRALAEADPARARVLARAAASDADLAVAAFELLAQSGPIPDESAWVEALLAVIESPAADSLERARAIEALVPSAAPLRFRAGEVDAALVRLLEQAPRDVDGSALVGPAARALARRGRVEAFDPLLQAWSEAEADDVAGFAADQLAGPLVTLALRGGPRERRELATALRSRLHATRGLLAEVVLAIWAADFRELLPELERVATSSPDDVESDQASSWQSGALRPVTGRFHVARKVAALWNEDDALTRARLLLALAWHEDGLATLEREERTAQALALAAASLANDPVARDRLHPLLARLESLAGEDRAADLVDLASEAFFGAPPK